jgi:uncharacterized protein (TIGR03790 family)
MEGMFPVTFKPSRLLCLVVALLCFWSLGLSPQQIALVVNQNEPASLMLAKAYAKARDIPDGRIISLNVPDAEEMDFDTYETAVVPPIRAFLRENDLDRQVRCLVTFYGVPFRIRAKTDTEAEKTELADLEDQEKKTFNKLEPLVEQTEKLALKLDPNFRPPPVQTGQTEAQRLGNRFIAAVNAASGKINAMTDPQARHDAKAELTELIQKIGGPAEVMSRIGLPELNDPTQSEDVRRHWMQMRDDLIATAKDIAHNEELRYDPVARAQVRQLSEENFGPIRLAEMLELQIDYLKPGTTNAATDSELADLWVAYYPRSGVWGNAMYFRGSGARAPVMMVSRLDGPDVATVARIIQTSVQVEKTGLQGVMALNSFGYSMERAADGRNYYKEFDGKIRDLSLMVRSRTKVPVVADYTHIFKDREVENVALYCGWYSLRHYVPGMEFSPGAVGYHVASLEMVGLHSPNETGWVRGLLKDGVTATLGAVAEPYLGTFPQPQDFFPLLMTGKLTLAEVFWRTEPTTSWMICLIGDPLYTPYKVNPAMAVEDLPRDLKAALYGTGSAPNSSSRGQ